ncbi:hypothetical protein FH972_025511 [Carpinus fangiana]|uniref:Uncharacterized protein n=1 Tax=Carpinus fangiana TaxID=176857 RepID=A0A5N6L181_9ROSI|nr:hypothetical protein FH972_025511 [Carpinus fangiana]
MADKSWRHKIHPGRAKTPTAILEHDEHPSASVLPNSPQQSDRLSRPTRKRLTTFLSGHGGHGQLRETEPFTTNQWSDHYPPPTPYNVDIEQSAQIVMSYIMKNPVTALPTMYNREIMHIIGAFSELRNKMDEIKAFTESHQHMQENKVLSPTRTSVKQRVVETATSAEPRSLQGQSQRASESLLDSDRELSRRLSIMGGPEVSFNVGTPPSKPAPPKAFAKLNKVHSQMARNQRTTSTNTNHRGSNALSVQAYPDDATSTSQLPQYGLQDGGESDKHIGDNVLQNHELSAVHVLASLMAERYHEDMDKLVPQVMAFFLMNPKRHQSMEPSKNFQTLPRKPGDAHDESVGTTIGCSHIQQQTPVQVSGVRPFSFHRGDDYINIAPAITKRSRQDNVSESPESNYWQLSTGSSTSDDRPRVSHHGSGHGMSQSQIPSPSASIACQVTRRAESSSSLHTVVHRSPQQTRISRDGSDTHSRSDDLADNITFKRSRGHHRGASDQSNLRNMTLATAAARTADLRSSLGAESPGDSEDS